MEIENINKEFSYNLKQFIPFRIKLETFLNSYEGKMSIINNVSNGETEFITNLKWFYSKTDFIDIIDTIYKFYLRNLKKTFYFSNVRFEKALLNMNIDLLGCNIVDEDNFRNIISYTFSKYKKINICDIDKLVLIFQDEIIFAKYKYLIEAHFYKNMKFVKQSILEIYDVNLNNKSLIEMMLCFTIFLIKLNEHNNYFEDLINDLLNFTYFDLIDEKRLRVSELKFIDFNIDKLNTRKSTKWYYLSKLNYKKTLLNNRISYIDSFSFLMSNNYFIKYIENIKFINENYYEYLLYIEHNKKFIVLNDKIINNIKKILFMNKKEYFILLLSILNYYFLTKKQYFNSNQYLLIDDYKKNSKIWMQYIIKSFYLYYFSYNDEDDDNIYNFDVYNALISTSNLLKFLLSHEYISQDIYYDMVFIMLKFYNENHGKIQIDFILSFLKKIETKFVVGKGNLMYFFDMIYSSNENFNDFIENVVDENYEYIIKYLKTGYIDICKIKNNRPIYDLFYNMNTIMIDIKYKVEDIITGFPIVEFMCMPHDKNLFIDKATIYKWLRKKEINPFTNEYMDFDSLDKFNSIVHIKNICESNSRKVFSLGLQKINSKKKLI